MKLKRIALLVLFSGVLLLAVGALMPVAYWQFYASNNPGAGIIGGADAPSYTFLLFSALDGLPFVLMLFGVSLILSAGFCLLFSKTVENHCHLTTSAISISLSACGGLGLVCAFVWFTIAIFGEVRRYPVEYPASVMLGASAFVVFLGLIALYFKVRMEKWSLKGFLIDVGMSILYLPGFCFAFMWLYEILA